MRPTIILSPACVKIFSIFKEKSIFFRKKRQKKDKNVGFEGIFYSSSETVASMERFTLYVRPFTAVTVRTTS